MTLRSSWTLWVPCSFSIVMLFMSLPAFAQMTGAPTPGYRQQAGAVSSAVPAALRGIGFDQKLDQRLPLDATFVDEQGQTVPLSSYFGSKPVVLAFVYYECPMLCTQVLSAMTSTFGVLALDAGKDFEIVTISFDPREGPESARARKATYLERYNRPTAAAGWHFLTGEEAQIKK